jgi:hypothetical protein
VDSGDSASRKSCPRHLDLSLHLGPRLGNSQPQALGLEVRASVSGDPEVLVSGGRILLLECIGAYQELQKFIVDRVASVGAQTDTQLLQIL